MAKALCEVRGVRRLNNPEYQQRNLLLLLPLTGLAVLTWLLDSRVTPGLDMLTRQALLTFIRTLFPPGTALHGLPLLPHPGQKNVPAFTSKARILFTDSPKHFFKSPRAFFKNHKSLCPPRIIMRSLRLNRAVDVAESTAR